MRLNGLAAVSAVYELATGRAGTASVRGDVSWQSRVFFTPVNDTIETQRAYGLVHLRAGFEPPSRRWEIAVYVRNAREPGLHYRHGQRPDTGDYRPSRRAAPLGHAVHPAPLSRHDIGTRRNARNFAPQPRLVTTPAKPRDLHRTSSDPRRDSRSARKRAEEKSWDREGRAYRRSSHRCSFPGSSLRSDEAIAESPPEQFPHDIVALTTSQNLLAADPNAIARFLETARPAPVSAEDKARVLSTLPREGEVTDFSGSARQKLAALTTLLRATERESVYEIKVIDCAAGSHRPACASSHPHLGSLRSTCSMRTSSRHWWPTKSGTSTSGRNANVPSSSLTAAVSRIWSSCATPSPS